jgi:hypothetical protein
MQKYRFKFHIDCSHLHYYLQRVNSGQLGEITGEEANRLPQIPHETFVPYILPMAKGVYMVITTPSIVDVNKGT